MGHREQDITHNGAGVFLVLHQGMERRLMRIVRIGEIEYARHEEPTAIKCGLWMGVSMLLEQQHRTPFQVERETAVTLDRLAHIEGALIAKERDLQSVRHQDVSILIDEDKRTLLMTGVPLVLQNGNQNITLNWET